MVEDAVCWTKERTIAKRVAAPKDGPENVSVFPVIHETWSLISNLLSVYLCVISCEVTQRGNVAAAHLI